MLKRLIYLVLAGIALFLLIQLVPYGHSHTNPPVVAEPAWSSPQVRAIAVRACFDCHSNQTTWPWYSNIAPVSWLVQRDVDSGRRRLNFSEWGTGRNRAGRIGEAVLGGRERMPPSYYVLMHPAANLTAADRQMLAQGIGSVVGQASQP